ncbi:hypothetical protein D9615_004950 [Tricholomella constricta]|uniref:Uncharacterized protein n=1 Tax=Tricholomella constricta TaxID=117010 RepID=A0A8H5HH42_9AGAR|nr:hypothetical protein D9615_004950 [Tricholomella constricta]
MILSTPKKVVALAKHYAPAWLSPTRLFAPAEPPVITEMPRFPSIAYEVVTRGIPAPVSKSIFRGPNGSYHHSRVIRRANARRAYNSWHKKALAYEAHKAKAGPGPLPKRRTPIPTPTPTPARPTVLETLRAQVHEHLGHSPIEPEDRILLDQLAKLNAQPGGLSGFEALEADLRRLDKVRARGERAMNATPSPEKTRARRVETPEARERRLAEEFARAQKADRAREKEKRVNKEQKAREEQKRREEEERERKEWEKFQRLKDLRDRAIMLDRLRAGQPAPFNAKLDPAKVRAAEDFFREEQQQLADARAARARAEEVQRQRLAREQEAVRLRAQQEEYEQRQRALDEQARQRAEMQARQRALEEQARQRAEEEARQRALEEQFRQRAEEEARQRALEEQARQRAEEQVRQRVAQEQARQRALEEQALRQAQAKANTPPVLNPFEIYDLKWQALKGPDNHANIPFPYFPWPVLRDIFEPSQISLEDVDRFLVQRGCQGKTPKENLKAEILKWHPDKFHYQLKKVFEPHQQAVREGGELVAKFLNILMERVAR